MGCVHQKGMDNKLGGHSTEWNRPGVGHTHWNRNGLNPNEERRVGCPPPQSGVHGLGLLGVVTHKPMGGWSPGGCGPVAGSSWVTGR